MDLAPPPVGELYVSDEKFIVAANTWAGAHQSRARITPRQMLTTLRLDNDPDNPMFKAADIYNVKAALRRDALGPLTPIQALLQNLHRDDWHCEYLKDRLDRVTHLFVIKKTSKELLKVNPEVLIMDCTVACHFRGNCFKHQFLHCLRLHAS
jgi:hypothetical protein